MARINFNGRRNVPDLPPLPGATLGMKAEPNRAPMAMLRMWQKLYERSYTNRDSIVRGKWLDIQVMYIISLRRVAHSVAILHYLRSSVHWCVLCRA